MIACGGEGGTLVRAAGERTVGGRASRRAAPDQARREPRPPMIACGGEGEPSCEPRASAPWEGEPPGEPRPDQARREPRPPMIACGGEGEPSCEPRAGRGASRRAAPRSGLAGASPSHDRVRWRGRTLVRAAGETPWEGEPPGEPRRPPARLSTAADRPRWSDVELRGPPQLVENVPYSDMNQMHAFAEAGAASTAASGSPRPSCRAFAC